MRTSSARHRDPIQSLNGANQIAFEETADDPGGQCISCEGPTMSSDQHPRWLLLDDGDPVKHVARKGIHSDPHALPAVQILSDADIFDPPFVGPSVEDMPTKLEDADTLTVSAEALADESQPLRFGNLPSAVQEAILALSRPPISTEAAWLEADVSDAQHTDLIDLVTSLDTETIPTVIQTAILDFTRDAVVAARAHLYVAQSSIVDAPTVVMPVAVPQARRLASPETLRALLTILLFVTTQVVWIVQATTGPFMDESLYILAGLRTLEGFGLADGYLNWFAGSLLWPSLAALASLPAGLVGARLLAAMCSTIALIATWRAARAFFGGAAGIWTLVTFALSGPLLHLAHLAVYDQIALAGIGLSLWALSKLGHSNERRWLVVAAIAFAIAVIGKYPMALCLGPLLGVMLALRRGRARTDIFLLLYISTAVLLIYAVPLRQSLTAFLIWRAANNPNFGATPAMVAYTLVVYTFPVVLLGAAGMFVVRNRRLAASLFAGLLLWPTYHLITANSVGAEKHIVVGFLFGYPLVGAALAHIWAIRGHAAQWVRPVLVLTVLALALVGVTQATLLDRSWADTRPAAAYLAAHVYPGQRVLASNSSPYQLALYKAGAIKSPWDVYDDYRVQHGQYPGNLCTADWMVDEQGGTDWSPDIRARIAACGTFVPVFRSTSEVTSIGQQLNFVTYPVHITVWVNIARH